VPASSGDASGWGEGGRVVIIAALKGNIPEGKNSYQCGSKMRENIYISRVAEGKREG